MIRHISVFTFKDTPDKQQNMETVKAYLEKVPTLYPAIKAQTIGAQAADIPSLPDDAPVMFGDLIESKFLTEGNWNVGSALSLIMMVLILISLSILRKADPKGEGGGIA